jgi:hypothetical protein
LQIPPLGRILWVLVLVGTQVAGCLQQEFCGETQPPTSAEATSASSPPTVSPSQYLAPAAATLVAIGSPTPDPNMPPERQDLILRQYEMARAIAEDHPLSTTRSPLPLPATPVPHESVSRFPRRPAGGGIIWDREDQQPRGLRFYSLNRWYRECANGQQLVVLAGVDGTDPQQGMVAVVEPADSNSNAIPGRSRTKFYPTPAREGPVRVVDATGQQLVLSSMNGAASFIFDVSTREFLVGTPTLIPSQ